MIDPDSTVAPGSQPAPAGRGAWAPGAQVAGYVLERELGSGGMGVVYQAVDAQGRKVAIKTLLREANETHRERFRREGEAQARADRHPNVVRVHAAGEHAGRQYLVMDLAAGGDLATQLKRRGRFPAGEARELVTALARGVAHVHAQGLLHRDIKPGNVLFDERGTPRLVDFGIARVHDAESLTRSGQTIGTIGYMAPEQVDDAKHADARADVYALGALLFALLTGEPPLKMDSAVSSIAALLHTPAPPLRSVAPDAPAALEAVCARALEKDPEARFPTAAALADALEAADLEPAAPRTHPWVFAPLLPLLLLGVWIALRSGPAERPSTGSSPPATATAAPTPAASPAAPPPWAIASVGTLTYGVVWDETAWNGNTFYTEARLDLTPVAGAPAGRVRLEVRWTVEGKPRLSKSLPYGVPPRFVAAIRDIHVLTADLDPTTGVLTDLRPAARARARTETLLEHADPRLEGRVREFAIGWAMGFAGGNTLLWMLRYLFAQRPVVDRHRKRKTSVSDFRWTGDRAKSTALHIGNIYPLTPHMWTFAEVSDHFHTSRVAVIGSRTVEEGLPERMHLEQIITTPDADRASDTVRVVRRKPK